MSTILSKNNDMYKQTVASSYYKFLVKNMESDKKLFHLECDLGSSLLKSSLSEVLEKFPNQYLEVGIQEANAIGLAAGLSITGNTTFVHSFAPFMARRACDQIFLSGAYAKSNIKVIGSDPGVLAAYNGGTHMPFEDIGIIRTMPEVTIIEPSDAVIAEQIFEAAYKTYGVFYIRLCRKNAVQLYEEGTTFEIGKGNIIKDGCDVTIIASGAMVEEGLKAVEILKAEGISARLVDILTIKPIDKELVLKCAQETGAIVTAENHNVINGLHAAVAEVVNEKYLIPIGKIGIKDKFGQVGEVDYLKKTYELTGQDIANECKKTIERKLK